MNSKLHFRTFSFGIFQHVDLRFCLVLHGRASVSSHYVLKVRGKVRLYKRWPCSTYILNRRLTGESVV